MTWGQHSIIRPRPGCADELLAKFVQVVELQRDNPACLLTLVGRSENSSEVHLTEVWASREAHSAATQSARVAAWAEGMPDLVDGPPSRYTFVPAASSLEELHRVSEHA